MVKWTEEERRIIRGVWEKVDIDEIGEELWARALIVYPWIDRYFGSFGDIFTTTAILKNPKLAALGKVVLSALDTAVKNMDNFKAMYAPLSRQHYEKIKVDPDNFRVSYYPDVQATNSSSFGRMHHNYHRLQTQS
ncbi:hemoglobin subunit beta-1-like isoform X2 [Poecilia formosa]|uniref:hemoglobin subunit beta-1-like isoform X2 n=1 Tax=Poecilia formosa TaxID=48698 RepID=UPI00044398FC|nr:PREDICTED: hemoglobin subunit beta-1-like isoform X2 [Poecilia formosa]